MQKKPTEYQYDPATLYSFPPLFFFTVHRIIDQRAELRRDREFNHYVHGMGFDQDNTAGKKLPSWIYFFFNDATLASVKKPFQLEGFGIPGHRLLHPETLLAEQQGTQFNLFKIFERSTPDTVPTLLGQKDLNVGVPSDASVVDLIRRGARLAATRESILKNDASQVLMSSKRIINGVGYDNQNPLFTYAAENDQQRNLDEANLANLGIFGKNVDRKQIEQVLNFAIAGESDRYLNRDTYYKIQARKIYDTVQPQRGLNRLQWTAQEAGRLMIRDGRELPPARVPQFARRNKPMTLEEIKAIDPASLKIFRQLNQVRPEMIKREMDRSRSRFRVVDAGEPGETRGLY